MKNLKQPAVILNLILIALLAFLLWRDYNKSKLVPESNGFVVTDEQIASMKENNIIPLTKAVKMYRNYTKDRNKLLEKTLKKIYKDSTFEDTRNVWINIDSLRIYLEYLKRDVSETEGLAFYFSVNPDNDPEDKRNHQTFFIAPTIENEVNGIKVQSGFTFDKNGDKVFLYEKFKNASLKEDPKVQGASFFTIRDHHEDGTLFNRGGTSPPNGNN